MSKKSRQKTGYQVTNWSAYNKSLVNRGDITFWFSEEVLSNWEHENKGFKVGRPFVYSDTAIEVLKRLKGKSWSDYGVASSAASPSSSTFLTFFFFFKEIF